MYEEIRRKTDYGVGYELLRIDPNDRKAIIRSDDGGKTWQTIDHKNIRMKGLRQTDTEIEYLGEDGRWYHRDAWGNTKLELTYEEQTEDRKSKKAAKKAAKKAQKEQEKLYGKNKKKSGCLGKIIKAPFKLLWWVVKWLLIICTAGALTGVLNKDSE